MSIARLNRIAAQREIGAPEKLAEGAPEEVQVATATGTFKAQPAGPETEAQGYLDVLVSAIPTEPLALYTFLIGGIVATLQSGGDQRLTMRWIIYGATIAFIALWLALSFRRLSAEERKKRTLPVAEILSAGFAFAAWGLVMPESPLGAELSGEDRIVWTLIITAAGAAIVGLLATTLTAEVKKPGRS